VLLDGVAEVAGGAVDRPLQPRIAERLHLAAIAADEMVMMVAVRAERLVARDSVPGVDPLHQPEIRKRLECPVDARDPNRPFRRPEPVEDLLRAEATVLAVEQTDDGLAGTPAPVAGVA
jgi:hypothetical protein